MFVALNHEVPGLLRKGSPVVEHGDCGMRGCEGIVVPSITRPGELAIRWHGRGGGMETSFTRGRAGRGRPNGCMPRAPVAGGARI